MRNFQKLNIGFRQKQANIAKAGAYYTLAGEVTKLSSFFEFKENEEYTVLDPAIGDGKALFTVTKKEGGKGDNIKAFGIDVNPGTIKALEASGKKMEALICADYLGGTKIKPAKFSFVFDNPPYIEEQNTIINFINRDHNMLMRNGAYCLVIPWSYFEKHKKALFGKFFIHHVYKFIDEEFQKWHQVAILGTKRTTPYRKDEFEMFSEKYSSVEELEEIPTSYAGEKIPVPAGKSEEVTPFCTKEFDACKALTLLRGSKVGLNLSGKCLDVPAFSLANCGNPPQPPRKDHLFTLTVVGIGQGGAGSVESGDYHLQRGVCRTEVLHYNKAAEPGSAIAQNGGSILVERTQAKTSMIVFEQDGTFTELK